MTANLAIYQDTTTIMQEGITFHPRLVPGNAMYERLLIQDPKKLKRMIREEQQLAADVNTLEYQKRIREQKQHSEECLRDDIASGKFAQRAEEFHRLPSHDVNTKGHAFAVLGISANSKPSMKIIKNTYRRQAKLLHPDVGGNAEAFKQLNVAYRILMQG